jgi:Domain of unknown function (DUF4249)
MRYFVGIFIALLMLASCEKDVDFDLKNAPAVLVVDAQIENGLAPTVILSKSLDFFGKIDPLVLSGSFVRNAEVTMSNGTRTHKLKEYTIPIAPGIVFYYYSIDSTSLATAFAGEFNKQYTLSIKTEGKEYTATAKIPLLTKVPDSLWWIKAPFNPDTNKVVMMVKTTDPPGLGNYIRYFTRKNREPFLPGEASVFDDAVIDGVTYELRVDPGIDRNNRVPYDSNYFKRGDTVTLKLCNIEKPTFTFWNTWEFAYQSIGNPFAQPNKVIGNISNGALGAFCGYAAWYKTLIIPR